MKFLISNHAHKRWNQRIFPILTKESIENFINNEKMIKEIEIYRDFYIVEINRDIIGIGRIKNDCMYVATFLGRKSVNPVLNNTKNFMHYNYIGKYKINLDIKTNQSLMNEFFYQSKNIFYDRKKDLIFNKRKENVNDFLAIKLINNTNQMKIFINHPVKKLIVNFSHHLIFSWDEQIKFLEYIIVHLEEQIKNLPLPFNLLSKQNIVDLLNNLKYEFQNQNNL